ncbi:hypothetical protein [Archaeoglobus sp.]
MMHLIFLTLILLNNTTFPGGVVNVSVSGNGTLILPNNCTYFCNTNYSNSIEVVKGGVYSICVSYSCKPGNYSVIADGKTYNFTVLKPSYEYLLNATATLERKIRHLQSINDKLVREKELFSAEIRKLKSENVNLTIQLHECIQTVKNLKDENKYLRENVSALRMQVKSLKSRINELEKSKNRLEYVLNNLTKLQMYLKYSLVFLISLLFGSYVGIWRGRR